eukprot:137216-Pyramimonas_sp.AAC.2
MSHVNPPPGKLAPISRIKCCLVGLLSEPYATQHLLFRAHRPCSENPRAAQRTPGAIHRMQFSKIAQKGHQRHQRGPPWSPEAPNCPPKDSPSAPRTDVGRHTRGTHEAHTAFEDDKAAFYRNMQRSSKPHGASYNDLVCWGLCDVGREVDDLGRTKQVREGPDFSPTNYPRLRSPRTAQRKPKLTQRPLAGP